MDRLHYQLDGTDIPPRADGSRVSVEEVFAMTDSEYAELRDSWEAAGRATGDQRIIASWDNANRKRDNYRALVKAREEWAKRLVYRVFPVFWLFMLPYVLLSFIFSRRPRGRQRREKATWKMIFFPDLPK